MPRSSKCSCKGQFFIIAAALVMSFITSFGIYFTSLEKPSPSSLSIHPELAYIPELKSELCNLVGGNKTQTFSTASQQARYGIVIYNPNNYTLNNFQLKIDLLKAFTKAVNGTVVFDFYDDFKFKDTSKWSFQNSPSGGTYSFSLGIINFTGDWGCPWCWLWSSKGEEYAIWSIQTFTPPFIVEFRAKAKSLPGRMEEDIALNYYNKYYYVDIDQLACQIAINAKRTTYTKLSDTNWHTYKVKVLNKKICLKVPWTNEFCKSGTIPSSGKIGISGDPDVTTNYIYFDWIRIRKYADKEPATTIDTANNVINVTNPNAQNLQEFQVYVNSTELSKLAGDVIVDIKDQNGNRIPFCYEHSNGECNSTPSDIVGIWMKVPNITANSQIQLKYITLNQITNDFNFKLCYDTAGISCVNYCFEQSNGECNSTTSNVVWVKVKLGALSNTTLYLIPSNQNEASTGDQVFDFYDDFHGSNLNTSKWQVKYFRYDGSPDTVKYVKVGNGYVEIALQDGRLGDGASSYGIEADISQLSFSSIVVEYRSITPNWGGTGSAGWYRSTGESVIGTSGFISFSQNEWGNRGHQNNGITTTSTADYSSVYPPNIWHIYKIIHTNTESSFFIDGNLLETLSSTPPTTPFISLRFSAAHWGTTSYPVSILRVDWIRIRKYAPVEPYVVDSIISTSNGGTLVFSSGSSQYPVSKNVIEAQLNLFITQIKKEYEERGDFINISYKLTSRNTTFNITLYSPELYITANFTC